MTDTPKLGMTFHKKSGRFLIKSEGDHTLRFPTQERVYEIWQGVFPNTDFFIGSGIDNPVIGFYADVGTGTQPKKRQEFCDALATTCVFAERVS